MMVYFGVFMSGIIIQNHMDVFSLGSLPLDESQKLDKFLMAMPMLTLTHYSSLGYIEGSKKAGGSVPFVIMGMPFHLPGLKWQQGLSSIQSLNLTLFVNRKHQCILWGVQIQSHDINNLRNQLRVVAIFKGLNPVRLKLCSLPNTMNCHMTDIHLFSQRASAPVGGILRLAKGSSHDLLNLLFADGGRATWFRNILQPVKALLEESPFPQDNRGPRGMKFPGYRGDTSPSSGSKDDAGS